MNGISRIWLVALLTVLLVGCSSAAPSDKPAATEASYPAPQTIQEGDAQPYPGPQAASATPSAEQLLPYPGPVEQAAQLADWSQIEGALLAGNVAEIYVAASQHVTLVLKDGSILLSIEPTQGEIARLIDTCADACKDIQVTLP